MRSFLSPVSISTPFYGNLKLLKLLRTERSRSEDVRSEERTWDLLHKGRALTDCAILLLSILFFFFYFQAFFSLAPGLQTRSRIVQSTVITSKAIRITAASFFSEVVGARCS